MKLNNLGFPQDYDEDGYEVCCDCGRLHKNLGNGAACVTCQDEMLRHCESMDMSINEDYEYEKPGGFDHMST